MFGTFTRASLGDLRTAQEIIAEARRVLLQHQTDMTALNSFRMHPDDIAELKDMHSELQRRAKLPDVVDFGRAKLFGVAIVADENAHRLSRSKDCVDSSPNMG